MEKLNDLKDLLRHEIEDLYSAEEQITEALPKMIEKANNETLKKSLAEHLEITRLHIKRLDQVQKIIGTHEEKGRKKGFLSGLFGGKHECKAMKGIIEESNKIMGEDMNPEVMDAAIIGSAQKVEHYEICGYGTARSFARELNLTKVVELLQETLDEEYEADGLLTVLAESSINKQAEYADENSVPGSSRVNAGRERVRNEEMELEPVTNRRTSSTTSTGNSSKPSGNSTRNTGTVRGSSSTGKSSDNTRKTSSKSSPGSSRRSSTGRGSSS